MVGAGPAGLMAALTAASAGAGVVVLERCAWAGGRLGLQTQALQGPRSVYRGLAGTEFCRWLRSDAALAGVEVVLEVRVSSVTALAKAGPALEIKWHGKAHDENTPARAVVLATGSWEPRPEFPGSTLEGVALSGDLQAALTLRGEVPGKRVLMLGSDNAGLLIAANLLSAGVEVPAVVDEAPALLGREVNVAPLRSAGVELLFSTRVVAATGTSAVEAVTLVGLDAGGAPVRGSERTLEVDTVCLAAARAPEACLAVEAGCAALDLDALGGRVPLHDRVGTTAIQGLYVCGDGSGVENGAVSLESGRLAGLEAAEYLGAMHPDGVALRSLAERRLAYLRRGRRGGLRRQAKAALEAAFDEAVRGQLENKK